MELNEENLKIHQNFIVKDLNYIDAQKYTHSLEHISASTNQCFFIFDFYKQNFYYLKPHSEYFPFVPENIDIPFTFYITKIFEEDLDFVYKIHRRAYKYTLHISPERCKNLSLFYNCRFENCKNRCKMTDVNVKVLETDNKGNIWLLLFILNPALYDNYKLPYIKFCRDDKVECFNFDIDNDILSELTNAEKDLATAIFSCNSNNEIANYLDKSPDTIKNQLTNLYRKFQINDKFEFQRLLLCGK